MILKGIEFLKNLVPAVQEAKIFHGLYTAFDWCYREFDYRIRVGAVIDSPKSTSKKWKRKFLMKTLLFSGKGF